MNRLIIIGNGFDLAHGLKTSYTDFIKWYWAQRVDSFQGNDTNVSKDKLCTITIRDGDATLSRWSLFYLKYHYYRDIKSDDKYEQIQEIKEQSDRFIFEFSPLMERIDKSIETKGWVNIENDYYTLLKETIKEQNCEYTAKELNEQLAFLKNKLVEYLGTLEQPNRKDNLSSSMFSNFNLKDIAVSRKKEVMGKLGIREEDLGKTFIRKRLRLKHTMLLNFNYTDTVEQLYGNIGECNHIHGELSNPKNIIFGYGDELDKDFKEIEDMSDNELLKYAKSVRYLETGNYRDFLRFIEADLFQVFIMGHSCGNSDRTLLHTVFEHKNCVSIKPFYHKKEDGSDNYLELVQNISRNFNDKELLRDRVVNKERCETM